MFAHPSVHSVLHSLTLSVNHSLILSVCHSLNRSVIHYCILPPNHLHYLNILPVHKQDDHQQFLSVGTSLSCSLDTA